MSVMTESRNVSWRPISEVQFVGRKPKACSAPGCLHKPTNVRITHTPKMTRRFAYCDGHLYY